MAGADAAASLRSYVRLGLPCVCCRAVSKAFHYLTCRLKDKRWDSKRMLGSGGMPSSHSATVAALATAIGVQDGAGESSFAIAIVLACVAIYDGTGIRLHAGQQAELLNQIVCELPPEHPVANVRPLRDSLGHTPLQVVAGALLGCMVAFLLNNYLKSFFNFFDGWQNWRTIFCKIKRPTRRIGNVKLLMLVPSG